MKKQRQRRNKPLKATIAEHSGLTINVVKVRKVIAPAKVKKEKKKQNWKELSDILKRLADFQLEILVTEQSTDQQLSRLRCLESTAALLEHDINKLQKHYRESTYNVFLDSFEKLDRLWSKFIKQVVKGDNK